MGEACSKTDVGELILDPSCGSGSLGVACLRLGRRYLGCDVNPACVADAQDWLRAEERGQSLSAYRAGQMSLLSLSS